MRLVLLMVALAALFYFSYYISIYFKEQQDESKPALQVRELATAPVAETKGSTTEVPVTTPAPAPEAQPTAVDNNVIEAPQDPTESMLAGLQTDEGLALSKILQHLVDKPEAANRQEITDRLEKHFAGRFRSVLEAYTNEANHSVVEIVTVLKIALQSGSAEAVGLVTAKLQSTDAQIRSNTLAAITEADADLLTEEAAESLFSQLLTSSQTAEEPVVSYMQAMAPLLSRLSDVERRLWFLRGLESLEQSESYETAVDSETWLLLTKAVKDNELYSSILQEEIATLEDPQFKSLLEGMLQRESLESEAGDEEESVEQP